MNHLCHGEFFTDAGAEHYRCFADSSVISAAVKDGDECPGCGRKIDSVEAKGLTVPRAAGEQALPGGDTGKGSGRLVVLLEKTTSTTEGGSEGKLTLLMPPDHGLY